MLITEIITENYSNWDHQESADYSKHLEKTFGKPDEMTDEQTVWHNKDGFKRIVCRDEYILHGSPAPHYDFIYCYIDLEVPEDLSDELAKCSGSILIDHLKNEVGARCGSLTANATTLNFVLDVVAGRAEPVKEEYEKRILAMKDMFEKGERYELDWWPDESGDADPKNPYYAESVIDEASSPWTSSGKHPEDMNREELEHEIDIFKQYKKMGMSLSPQEIMRMDSLYDYLDTVDDRNLDENLRAWFGKGKKGGAGGGGWDRYNTKGERIGKCGDRKPGEGKPKCLSKSRAASLRAKGGKKAIAAAVRKKRREDPKKNRRGKAKNVSNTTRKK
tara:strand:- start:42 stop:1040 length:999 start_codon:yes stop_codon:yes gene_type:complete